MPVYIGIHIIDLISDDHIIDILAFTEYCRIDHYSLQTDGAVYRFT